MAGRSITAFSGEMVSMTYKLKATDGAKKIVTMSKQASVTTIRLYSNQRAKLLKSERE